MRRFLSIATILALLATPATPLFAASCPHTKAAMACHRVKHVHHCEMMHEEDAGQNDSQPNEAGFQGRASAPDCPMDCCAPSQRADGIAVVVIPVTAPAFLIEQALQFTPAVFVASGFSSHTDRGPPSA